MNTFTDINEAEAQKQHEIMERLNIRLLEKSKELGRPLTYNSICFGCQMNAKDSEKLEGILEKIGYVRTDEEAADFVIINTCTIRENANQRVYGRLGQLKSEKKKNPNMLIAMCGCMMQEKHVVDKLKKSYRHVDIIFGTHNVFKLAELIEQKLDTEDMVIDIWEDTTQIVEDLPSQRKFDFKCGVNIMFGCNNFCSYCIVPYVRGRERSRKPEDIIAEIKCLVSEGVVEVMLLGQNVNSYGKNLDEPITFAKLLEQVEQIEGLKRIRFMTSHPKDLSDELIEVMAKSKKICRHLHLPMQSGSTKVLNDMNRRYTKEDYLNLVDKIKKAIPDISLTTDIIVGFPTETGEDFEETLDVVRRVRFISAFTFIYSKRSGTPAAEMEFASTEQEIKERFDRLLTTVQDIAKEKCAEGEGKTAEILVEGLNDKMEGYLDGRLSNNLMVHFPGDESLIGTFQTVKLEKAEGFYYMGELA